MIEIKDCTLKFEEFTALDGINIEIPNGSAYGLLGSNGAGKSTLLRLVCGIYRPFSGSVTIDGEQVYDNAAVKEKVFFINDETVQFSNMSLNNMREYYRAFYPNFSDETFERLISVVGLPKNRKLHTFSKGMKRQAAVICGISCRTEYLLLDEAFDGLDPMMRKIVKDMLIDAMLDNGLTIIFSSHNLSEIDEFCDRIGLVHGGKLIFDRVLDDVKGDIIKVQTAFDSEVTKDTLKQFGIEALSVEHSGSITYIIARGGSEAVRHAVEKLSPKFYDEVRLTLNEIFIYEMEGLGYDRNNLG